jgi:hypothetical protein
MIVSIHQPHFFPWLGYLDRMRRCDLFVLLDHVQFERQNYQNRVRIKTRAGPRWLIAPVQQRSRAERIIDKRLLAEPGPHGWSARAFRLLRDAYGGAPFFARWAGEVREVLESGATHLVDLDLASIELLRRAFDIRTPLVRSSMLGVQRKGAELVLEICRTVRADAFLGGVGASRRYIDPAVFRRAGVEVLWQDFTHPRYAQHPCVPPFLEGVTALDVLFSCGPDARDVLGPCAPGELQRRVSCAISRLRS